MNLTRIRVKLVYDTDKAKFQLRNDYWGSTSFVESIYPQVNTWYCIELKYTGTWSTPLSVLYINGTEVLTINPVYEEDATTLRIGGYFSTGTTSNIYIDCVVVSDSYIGPEPSIKSSIKNNLNLLKEVMEL